MPKVAFVGAGNVGATAALFTAMHDVADVALMDVVEGRAEGKALDMAAAAPVLGFGVGVTGASGLSLLEGADVVVVTAGLARKPGMSRMDLLRKNAEIVGGVADEVKKLAPSAIVINVTNPLDVMTELILRRAGFERERVMGMAGVLDSARFRSFLASRLGADPRDIHAMVLGGHGDAMVPLVSGATCAGVPVEKLLSREALDETVERTRKAGGEVVKLLKTGSAFVSPAASVALMVRAVLRDEKRLLAACVHLEGEYGHEGVCLGVPVVLGRGGVARIVEMELSPDESRALEGSASAVREGIAALE